MSLPFARFFEGMVGPSACSRGFRPTTFARFFEDMVPLSPSRARQRCVCCQFSFTQKRSCAAVQTALETVCSSALSLRFQPFGSSKTPFPSPQSIALGLQVHMDWAVKAGGLRCKRPALVSQKHGGWRPQEAGCCVCLRNPLYISVL